MKVYIIILIMLVSMPAESSAETFTIETTTGATTTASTVTVDLPSTQSGQSPSSAIAGLVQELGGNADTLELLSEIFGGISAKVLGAISSEPIDIETLAIEAQRLADLAVRLQIYMLKDQLADMVKSSGVDDSWFNEILTNF